MGAHVTTTGGVHNAPGNARAIACRSFALFTRNQRRWDAPPLTSETIDAFHTQCAENGYTQSDIMAHDSYLVNLGNPTREGRARSYRAFLDEMRRCQALGIAMLNIHPGSHLGQISERQCIRYIASAINRALARTTGVTVVLENTAGQGTNIGYRFEHLADIMSLVADQPRVGVCLDTCHAHAAGYDLRTPDAYARTMDSLVSCVGSGTLCGCHLNDCLHELGSHRDRHAPVGEGHIGLDAFTSIMHDQRWAGKPLILETPNSDNWAEEIALLYSLVPRAPRARRTPRRRAGRKGTVAP